MTRLHRQGERWDARSRVLAAFAHEEPDRVPVDYCANVGIDARLKFHFGLALDDDAGLLRALGVDFHAISSPYTGPPLHAAVQDRQVDPLWGIRTRWIEHGSGGYWDFCDFPLRDADEDAVANWPMPSPDHFDYGGIPEQCAAYRDFCLYVGGPGLGDLINSSGMLRTMEQVLVDLMVDDPAWQLLIERKTAVQLEVAARVIEAAQGHIDFMWLGEDLGCQDAPLLSLERFRAHIRPRTQPFVDLAQSHGLPVMMHSCGSSSWAFDDFVEMGIDAVDTLQPDAKDMAPAYLKARWGGQLAFHGCIGTGGPLAFGSVGEVRRMCRETLDIMMPGGGYCFAPAHALQDNTPTENALAMYAVAQTHGRYSQAWT